MCLPDNVLECTSKDVSIMMHAEVDCWHRSVYKYSPMCSLEGSTQSPQTSKPESEPAPSAIKLDSWDWTRIHKSQNPKQVLKLLRSMGPGLRLFTTNRNLLNPNPNLNSRLQSLKPRIKTYRLEPYTDHHLWAYEHAPESRIGTHQLEVYLLE